MASSPIRFASTRALDMDLAFKTREKLACRKNREDSSLRRMVLLCNTYDTYQKRLTNHFCVNRALTSPAREEKLRISCWEVAVVGDDSEPEGPQVCSDSTITVQSSPEIADGEEPPPYELHPPPKHPGRAAPQVPKEIAITRASQDQPNDTATSKKQSDDAAAPNKLPLPTYTTTVQSTPPAPEISKSETHQIEVLPEAQSPPPPAPRKARPVRPGLSTRMSYGHRAVSVPALPG